MTQKIIEALFWGFCSGIVGFVYWHILGREEAFNWWWRYGIKYQKSWFWKPVWGCAFCFSGQFALWTFLVAQIWRFSLSVGISFKMVFSGLFCLIIAICFAILIAKILSWLFEKNNI